MIKPNKVRWQYQIFRVRDWGNLFHVREGPFTNPPVESQCLFSSDKLDECKLWVEQKEVEAGYKVTGM